MNYPQAIAWLYGTQHHGIKLGLEQIHRLLGDLGFNPRRRRYIHVAGTNGKGSVCAMLDAICSAGGYRTGLYTSPHLVSFRERIKLDGVMISEDDVAEGLTRIREIVSSWETHPTFFEITTALAFDYFQRKEAQIVVLETGLGGRLDSTNAIVPRVSVITPIDLDHQALLGSTIAEIAAEKAGIIKPGVPVVSAPQHPEAAEVLSKTAASRESHVNFVLQPLENLAINISGSHQKMNAALAVAALRAGAIDIAETAVAEGLKNVSWPGRFQRVGERIVLDGAHNEAAARQLALTWRETFGDERPVVILGVLQDKDMTSICRALLPLASSFIVTPVRSQRTSTPEQIQEIMTGLDARVNCLAAENLSHALEMAWKGTQKILVTGSLFLVGEALTLLGVAKGEPEIGSQ